MSYLHLDRAGLPGDGGIAKGPTGPEAAQRSGAVRAGEDNTVNTLRSHSGE